MKLPQGAIFARVTLTFRTKRFADSFLARCKASGLTSNADRERSRRGWHLVHVWLYRGEALP